MKKIQKVNHYPEVQALVEGGPDLKDRAWGNPKKRKKMKQCVTERKLEK